MTAVPEIVAAVAVEAGRFRSVIEVAIGVIGRAHGVRGEVTVKPRTDEPGLRFAPGTEVRIEGQQRRLTVDDSREHGGRLLVRFREVMDRTVAETLRGARLVVDVDPEARPDRPEEFYDRQLIGLVVLDSTGHEIGRIAGIAHLPGQDLLEVDLGGSVRLVPFVADLVPEVDLEAGRLRLAEVPGLLADEALSDDETQSDDEALSADEGGE